MTWMFHVPFMERERLLLVEAAGARAQTENRRCPQMNRSLDTLGLEKNKNSSDVSRFVLLGLSSSWELQLFLFFTFLLIYLVIVLGNLLIVMVVQADAHLFQSPMYYFLSHLSFIDLCLSCVAVPKMLGDFLQKEKTISFSGCLAQVFFLHFLGASEMFLLTVMAYDRGLPKVPVSNPMLPQETPDLLDHKVQVIEQPTQQPGSLQESSSVPALWFFEYAWSME